MRGLLEAKSQTCRPRSQDAGVCVCARSMHVCQSESVGKTMSMCKSEYVRERACGCGCQREHEYG